MLLEHHVRPVPSIRFVRSCSSALSPALLRRLEDAHGVVTLEAYGMTEASHQIASNPMPPAAREPGSVGIATGTGIRIVDQEWRDVDFGAGEVVISGPGITPGYLGNEQANAESFSQGWFRTGDRGTIEGGYLRLLGRIKEMILRGGENISPYEIEEVLGAHEAVVDAVCFGVDDEKYGQRVGAAVTLRRDVDAEALRAHCRDHLAAFKVPDEVFILDAIPRTATGKVQRRHLARDLTEQHP
jgi:acyl-CoA synthetase (AMP-forming)/AMP-acid ligase II